MGISNVCKSSLVVVGVVIMLSCQWHPVSSHGRLVKPTARSSMWSHGYADQMPKNYNDNQMFCGGLQHQIKQGYRCGLCGDPYDGPRVTEAAPFNKGIITETYRRDQVIDIQVQITANHAGYFEFKLCDYNSPSVNATQECLDKHILELVNGQGNRMYGIGAYGTSVVTVKAKLPAGLTCDYCMLQWRYHAGNSWGTDLTNRKSCIGCGYQEEFYGCADVRITN